MNNELTPWQRLVESMKLEEPDQVPVILPVTGFLLSDFVGISVSQYFMDYKNQLKAQIAFQKRFPDATLLLGFAPEFYMEVPTALGCNFTFTETFGFVAEPVAKEPEDIDKLEVPDPHHDGLMPNTLKALEHFAENVDPEIKRRYGYVDGWPVMIIAPFSVAAFVRGITQFMLDLIMNQDLAHKLLKIATETTIEWIRAQEEIIGPTKYLLFVDDFSGLISRDHFERFFVPYAQRVLEKHSKALVLFHNDSNTRHILKEIARLYINGFHFGPDVDIGDAKRMIGDNVCLVGNVHPLRILLEGKPQDVERACMKVISTGAPRGGYVLCSGGEMSRGTPLENIDMMIETAKEYGKYSR